MNFKQSRRIVLKLQSKWENEYKKLFDKIAVIRTVEESDKFIFKSTNNFFKKKITVFEIDNLEDLEAELLIVRKHLDHSRRVSGNLLVRIKSQG